MGATTDRTGFLFVAGLAAIAASAIWTGTANAYDRWSVNDDATNCGECHGDFRAATYISLVDGQNWGNLHNLHRETMLNDDCAACHLASDEFPVLLNESEGGAGFEAVSCMGCHGVDPNPGTPNTEWGAGLRAHHLNAGVPPDQNGFTCLSCHPVDPLPPLESVPPSYYFTPDAAHPNKPSDPCNPSPGFPENYAGFTLGLDNDGDLAYDAADSNCGIPIFADGFESGDTSAWSDTVP